MNNYKVLVLLVGLVTASIAAFDENADVNPWSTPRERKIARMEEKRRLEQMRYLEPRYAAGSDEKRLQSLRKSGWDVKAPSNIKQWDFEKLQKSPGYPTYDFLSFGVGGRAGDPEYFYQKSGVDKQGKPYPRYTLKPNASQPEIIAEIERRRAYDEKQRQKINYWTKGVIGRWFHRNYEWARR